MWRATFYAGKSRVLFCGGDRVMLRRGPKVSVRQITQDADIDMIFGKTMGVLRRTERCQPILNLLHSGVSSTLGHIESNLWTSIRCSLSDLRLIDHLGCKARAR
jgi:hypothetical protein